MPQGKEQSCKEDPKEETMGTPLEVCHVGEYLLTLAGRQMEMAQETLRMGLMLKEVDCLLGPSKTPIIVFQNIWVGQETFHVNITRKKGTTKSGLSPQLLEGVKVCAEDPQKRKGSLSGTGVMNLRNSPDVPNRLLTDLSSLIVIKVNDPTSSSSKFFIRAITSPLSLHNKQKSRISHP